MLYGEDIGFDELRAHINFYYDKRGLTRPGFKDALDFLISEIGELFDAIKREDSYWVRNNERETSVAEELGDALMMILVASEKYGVDVEKALIAKMERKLKEMQVEKPEVDRITVFHHKPQNNGES